MYKIGIYKNGQQIAKQVFVSFDLDIIKDEFKSMFDATISDCWQDALDFGWESNTLDNITFEQAWEYKHFIEDTNNVAIFEVYEDERLHTNYTYQGCTSKIM